MKREWSTFYWVKNRTYVDLLKLTLQRPEYLEQLSWSYNESYQLINKYRSDSTFVTVIELIKLSKKKLLFKYCSLSTFPIKIWAGQSSWAPFIFYQRLFIKMKCRGGMGVGVGWVVEKELLDGGWNVSWYNEQLFIRPMEECNKFCSASSFLFS